MPEMEFFFYINVQDVACNYTKKLNYKCLPKNFLRIAFLKNTPWCLLLAEMIFHDKTVVINIIRWNCNLKNLSNWIFVR